MQEFYVYEPNDIYRYTHKKVSPLLWSTGYRIIEKLKIKNNSLLNPYFSKKEL